MAQFEAARRAKTDDDCMACLRALRAENTSLLEQSRLLKTGYAKLYAEVKVVRDENKIVGYIISAVDVVVAGAAIFGGIVMMSSMTPVGVVADAVIVVNGFNTISREAAHNLLDDKQTEGIFADGSMEIAEFLGFSRQLGLGTYKASTLFSEVYLGASRYDDEQAKHLRNAVSTELYEIYMNFQALSEGSKVKDFKDALKKADELRVWRYAGLTLPFVPYILLTLVDQFNKKDSPFRKDDFFFILPSEIRLYDDLWIKPYVKKKIIKISKKFEVLGEFPIRDSITPVLHPAWFDVSFDWLTKQV